MQMTEYSIAFTGRHSFMCPYVCVCIYMNMCSCTYSISQEICTRFCITTTKHSKAKTVCIFLGIYCMCVCVSIWIHMVSCLHKTSVKACMKMINILHAQMCICTSICMYEYGPTNTFTTLDMELRTYAWIYRNGIVCYKDISWNAHPSLIKAWDICVETVVSRV